jgi:hypothetical protein
MPNSSNVTAAKPKGQGGIYSAPLGTVLPTDATTALDAAFQNLGYVSEDGVQKSNSTSSEKIKAWGGDVVASFQTEKEVGFKYKLIEGLSINVLKEIYGEENVTGDLATGIKFEESSDELKERSIIIDMALSNGLFQRIVIPKGKITEVGDVTYKGEEVVGYEVTLTAFPDENGKFVRNYIDGASEGE